MRKYSGRKRLFEETINQIMKSGREIYLKGSPGNKGSPENPGFSGVKRRPMAITLLGSLTAPSAFTPTFPVTDRVNSRPLILPQPYQRVGASYIDVIYSLIINGYSPSQLQSTLSESGLPYTQDETKKIIEELRERLEDFKTRQLPSEVFAIFIDGYHRDIKQSKKVRKTGDTRCQGRSSGAEGYL